MSILSCYKNILLCFVSIVPLQAYANTQVTLPSYSGVPKQDLKFAQFLEKNKNKIVQLNLSIKNHKEYDDIRYGYRGTSPTFYVASTAQKSYSVFIDCDQIANQNTENTIGQCAPYVSWNDKTGNLRGQFKVQYQGKNAMGDQLFNLVATKPKQMTVVVKEHLGMSESGDGYRFTTKTGHEFFVYNAGGAIQMKGEHYIKENATICLKFDTKNDVIASVLQGACR